MDAYSPYAGTLVIPDQLVAGDSPVHLTEGEVVLKIRRPMLPIRGAFELLDPDGEPLAYGRAKGFVRPRYPLEAPDGTTLLELVLGLKGASGASTVTLPDGRRLSAQGTWWTLRRFSVLDGEAEVAAAYPATNEFPFRPDAYVFELRRPVLSIAQAVGLAQSLRAAARSARSVHAPQVG